MQACNKRRVYFNHSEININSCERNVTWYVKTIEKLMASKQLISVVRNAVTRNNCLQLRKSQARLCSRAAQGLQVSVGDSIACATLEFTVKRERHCVKVSADQRCHNNATGGEYIRVSNPR